MNPAIHVKNLGKVFKIFDHPADRLKEAFSLRGKKYSTEFAALTDVSFEIEKGRFIGVIGRNGAGKSTLLRLLSGELKPTSGTIEINGSVSLLQLGVGFNPELSGIENARFASKILGYTDKQIDEIIGGIIEFADIGEFINRPVKTYSSGMYSRLSFAVGINVDPDILIADEVLAVGDIRFSQKCLRKMREFKERGKTVIIVTHDVETVNTFCDEAIWIMDGRLFMRGEPRQITEHFKNYMFYNKLPNEYLEPEKELAPQAPVPAMAPAPRRAPEVASGIPWVPITNEFNLIGEGGVEGVAVALVDNEGKTPVSVYPRDELKLLIKQRYTGGPQPFDVGIAITNGYGQVVMHTNNVISQVPVPPLEMNQTFVVEFSFEVPPMNGGNYLIAVAAQELAPPKRMLWRAHEVFQFSVLKREKDELQCGLVLMEKVEVRCEVL